MFQPSRPRRQMSWKRLQWNATKHSDSHDRPLSCLPLALCAQNGTHLIWSQHCSLSDELDTMHDDDLMTPSDEFDAKACRLTANKLTFGWMPINDVGYHLFEQGLCKDLSKPALSVCIANPLFGSLVWVVLPSQARSTGGRAIIKPHKRLVKSPIGAVVCTLQAYLTTTSMILSSRGYIQKSLSHLLVCCQLVPLSARDK